MRTKTKIHFEKTYVTLVCILTNLFLFHNFFFSGFNLLLGDRFDTLIETNILQHWYNFFTGNSHWSTVGYFYPFKNTLGYNDGYFLYGVIYSIFRFINLDIFISAELVNVFLKVIGYFSFYWLTRNILKFNFLPSICSAVAFTLGNSLIMQMPHVQLLSIAFSPLLTIFIINYAAAIKYNKVRSAVLNGSATSMLLALWLFTSFYMAWYFVLFFCIASVVFFMLCISNNRLRRELEFKFSLKSIIFPILTLAVFIIPFLNVYLPKANETGGQSLDAAETYAPHLLNVIDPGATSVIYGKLSDYLLNGIRGLDRTGEFSVGLAPISVMLVILATIFLLFKKKQSIKTVFFLTLCFTTLFLVLLVIKEGDFFLWKYVWKYFPGAKGMRVTSRLCLYLIFPVSLISAYLMNLAQKTKYKSLALSFCVMVVIEQLNVYPNANFNRKTQLEFVKSLPPPPAECKAFYVIGQRQNELPNSTINIMNSLYPHNVDAMLISELFHVRTINGFSTFNPPGWDFARDPLSTYMNRVQKYINDYHIQDGMCQFDLERLTWAFFVKK
ncbi:hypothetical protein ABU178_12520 [Pantoea osteomyelitidis]|uniref:Glycosyltransferase RgtA/B/C/D-like domain-containing protein n=1 Tax=Pantoea osteomyelitidis TaxID=3230026 RepID=A0ABW7Q098_9GAMM